MELVLLKFRGICLANFSARITLASTTDRALIVDGAGKHGVGRVPFSTFPSPPGLKGLALDVQ